MRYRTFCLGVVSYQRQEAPFTHVSLSCRRQNSELFPISPSNV